MINKYIIVVDFNQDIKLEEIWQFFTEIGILDMYYSIKKFYSMSLIIDINMK